jgi:hypothetical protein
MRKELNKKIISERFQSKLYTNGRKKFLYKNIFSELFSEKLETCGNTKYGKLDNIKQIIRFERCLHKARDTHSEYVEYIAVPRKNIYSKVPKYQGYMFFDSLLLRLSLQIMLLIYINC